ncbi:MAG: protein-L-isoaspartate O-methyltransferase [Ancrocorticia populi]|uniref:protein-L-isoaspartate O-methyltransferase n=1 Tax=Ancrocorticia populi TaxID=2175228 RepID=UPI003F9203BD
MSDAVTTAMREVSRADFLPESIKHLAHYDGPLPIGESQTNSQPYTVAEMLRLLDVHPGHRILDVGAGSGWTTALLAYLTGGAGTVIGLERNANLIGPAREALSSYVEDNARIDEATAGILGAPDEAPFDRILVSATAPRIPQSLVDQLADDGIMVIPVATTMKRVRRRGGQIEVTDHGQYRFVPLVED